MNGGGAQQEADEHHAFFQAVRQMGRKNFMEIKLSGSRILGDRPSTFGLERTGRHDQLIMLSLIRAGGPVLMSPTSFYPYGHLCIYSLRNEADKNDFINII